MKIFVLVKKVSQTQSFEKFIFHKRSMYSSKIARSGFAVERVDSFADAIE